MPVAYRSIVAWLFACAVGGLFGLIWEWPIDAFLVASGGAAAGVLIGAAAVEAILRRRRGEEPARPSAVVIRRWPRA